ncbi:FAD-dependent oxidoreductase [Agriterribacter sp.]|uniref:GcvT family protein n=1 Tax=Agriterribacter sp. TaxID=2821509 RepID=UPI002CEC2E6F|nr:FAD-dependent oxidoreductase [Agriterribacter sp.]HRO44810.1 FAD-dependent oxidoreductase [Agriterribacter sp.]
MPKIVIIGAGIVGCSLADELTERGYTDVVVIEKGPLWAPGGSTSHAPGVVFQTNGSRTMAQFAQQTVEKLYSLRHNGEPCFLKVGSLELATTPERLADLHRRAGLAISVGINAKVISPEEALRMHPMLAQDKLLGALYVPDDGIARAKLADQLMGERAISRGAKFIQNCEVTAIDQSDGHVTGVQTTQGSFPADIVVSCAGIWGPKIGAMVGMQKAIQPLAHQLCYTAPMTELAAYKTEAELPVLRHQGADLYFKQRGHSLAVGWYGHRPLPVRAEDILPNDRAEIMPSQMPFTPEEWKGAMEGATEVIPALKDAEIAESMNGLFSFTVDNFPLMGEWSGLKGFWVAEAVWITHGCGVARAMAEWIVNGHPTLAVHECDVNRFEPHQLGPQHIEERGAQNYIEVYDLLHPLQPMASPRPIRTTGFYQRQQQLGGFFLEAAGYERPQWYETNASLVDRYPSPPRDAWSASFWSPVIGAEARAVREGVGLFDITTLKRIEVIGKGALEFLERLTTGNLRKKTGSITYCLLLNESGGIMSDITIMRRGEQDFFIGVNSNIDINYLKQLAPDTVFVRDITAGTVALGLFGPKSRELAQSLTRDDLSNEALGYFRLKHTYFGHVPVMLARLSYVGELGYEIYTTADLALKVWDTLWQAGKQYGLIAAGRGAFNSMRLEKGYRSYGTDMTSEHNPYEAGLGFAVRKGGGFTGAEALSKVDQNTLSKRLVCLVLDNPQHVVLGKEPVLHEGKVAGYVTSAYFGHTIGKPLAYAWVPAALSTLGTALSIRYFDNDYPATVGQDPQYDAQMTRLKS